MAFKTCMAVVAMMSIVGVSWPIINTLMQKENTNSIDPFDSVESSASGLKSESVDKNVNSIDVSDNIAVSSESRMSFPSSTSAEEFIERKRKDIWQDQFGNFRTEVYLEGRNQSQRIIADGPIYYPSRWQLLESPQGCSSAGYYVDVQTSVALVDFHDGETKVFYYVCSVNEATGAYTFRLVDPVSHLAVSVRSKGGNKIAR